MSFPSLTLLLCLWLSPAVAYKLSLLDGALLTDGDNTIDNPNKSPFGIKYNWEWQSQDRMDEGTLMLARLRREIIDKKSNKGNVKPDGKDLPKVKLTEPPLEDLSNATPYILEASSAGVTKPERMPLLNEDETTPIIDLEQTSKGAGQQLDEDETTLLTDIEQTSKGAGQNLDEDETTPLSNLEQTTKGARQNLDEDETTPLSNQEQTTNGAGQKLHEDETTPLINLEQTSKKLNKYETPHVGKSITQSETLVNKLKLNPTKSEELSVLTTKKYNKATIVNQVHSTDSQHTSSRQISTNDKLLEDITSSFSPKAPSPSSTAVISRELTEHAVTIVWVSASSGSSAKPAAVTHITASIEDKVHTQYIMRQCMLTILILAIVCTIFIISTIALAAKLSTMKQKNKLRHPLTYTEMRCISSLLPDNDRQNKPRPNGLKTFAANMEESDGDNATLNSFLPDH